ncbi:MAG: tetratricopeptide repeat protein [Chitinophagales bacterium]|nr:tetratricopeptide repeat protein [Chitinophagales bacterium]
MKTTFWSTVLVFLITAFSTVNAQDCPKGDSESPKYFSLYKEYYKQGNIEKALPYWKILYDEAPGFGKTVFIDGAEIYEYLIQNTSDEVSKQKYVDTLLAIYDKRIKCWGDEAYVLQLKGISIAQYRPNDYPHAVKVLSKAIALAGNDAKYYGIATYFNLLINLKDEAPGINVDFIKKEYNKLVDICDANIQAGELSEQFQEVKAGMTYNLKEYVLPKRFAAGADWYSWTDKVKEDSIHAWVSQDSSISNVEDIVSNISRDADLKDSKVRFDLEQILFNDHPTAIRANNIGAYFYEIKDFKNAIPYFQKAVELTTDSTKKAGAYLALADTYRQADDFPSAREAARQAMTLDTTSAQPYYLIGVLYLSSGSKCGTGTGFNSQRVLWPAYDYFKKALELDPSFDEVVSPLMRDYKKFLPTRAEVAAKGLKVGGKYLVPCWINEEATVIVRD